MHGYSMFGTNRGYRNRNFNVTSHHPLRSAHDFFNSRVIKYWNQLPLRVRKSRSINAFKASLDLFRLSKPDSPNGQLAKDINLHQKELSITFRRNIRNMLIIGLSSQIAVRTETVNVTAHRVGCNT